MNISEKANKIDQGDRVRVEDSRVTAKWLRGLAIAAGLLGFGSIFAVGFFFFEGSMNAEQAVVALFSSAFFTIFAGAAAYGSASNLDLSASRLERQIDISQLELARGNHPTGEGTGVAGAGAAEAAGDGPSEAL
jgi:hypothetical protein